MVIRDSFKCQVPRMIQLGLYGILPIVINPRAHQMNPGIVLIEWLHEVSDEIESFR